jgi:hypothetical protein
MRRALLTHFRLFSAGIPAKTAKVSNAVRSAALISMLVGNERDSGGAKSTAPAAVLKQLFDSADAERSFDSVCWQGAYRPGEMPDIPGLLLRGMLQARSSAAPTAAKPAAAAPSSGANDRDASIARQIVECLTADALGESESRDVAYQLSSVTGASWLASFANVLQQSQQQQQPPKSGKAKSDEEEPFSLSEKAKVVSLLTTFALGLDPVSRIGSLLTGNALGRNASSPTSSAVSVGFDQLLSGMRLGVSRAADAKLAAGAAEKSGASSSSSNCGIGVLLQNCGDRTSTRWDKLLRETLARKSAVVLTHIGLAAYFVVMKVLRELGGSAKAAKNDEALIECYVKEVLRLNPAVPRAVRVADGDDHQRAETFGYSGDLVKRLCGVGLEKCGDSSSEKEKATTAAISQRLDPSIRLSNSGFLTVPSSAVCVFDIASMMRACKNGDQFVPARWKEGSASASELQETFAPFGFGAAAEAATRYVLNVSRQVILNHI